jgi:DNA-binding transcriptional LysR family regulator
MPLDVRRLRVLREVAAQGSFSGAAEVLAFTQPAVSRQIATLEAEAGTRLVDRTARGVRLTPAGGLDLRGDGGDVARAGAAPR